MTFVKKIADTIVKEIAATFPERASGLAYNAHRPTYGYTSSAGAGAILYSLDLGNYCFFQRAHHLNEPTSWGTVGGEIEDGETPEEACLREIKEEIGYTGPIKLIPFFVYRDYDFTFTNFIGVVPREFMPTLTEEVIGYRWEMPNHYPNPLHFGLKAILNDEDARRRLAEADFNPDLFDQEEMVIPKHAPRMLFD